LVLRDSDANGEMSIVERFPVVEPQYLVLRQLFGRGPSDSVTQQDRIKFFPEEIVSLCIREDDGEHDTRMQVVQVQDSRPSLACMGFLEVDRLADICGGILPALVLGALECKTSRR
jgi:hypothetical protein